MKKIGWIAGFVLTVAMACSAIGTTKTLAYSASDDGRIHSGVFAENVDLSGMTEEEASNAIRQYVEQLKSTEIQLNVMDGNFVTVTAGELGLSWENQDLVTEASGLGREGNIVERYKALKDLEHENKVYDVDVAFNQGSIESIVNEKCTTYNQEAVDATLEKTADGFQVVEGQNGLVVDVEGSTKAVTEYLNTQWDHQPGAVDLVVQIDEPKGKTEDLQQIKDVLGTFTTSFKTSAKGRSANVRNGCSLINGTLLYPGEQFSVYSAVSPFTEENGYYMAGSYLNGLVVESLGGGICQVSSTLYNAVLRAELGVDERSNHSMVVNYVDLSADAAISGESKDFKFTNTLDYPIYIEGSTTEDKKISFTIYGKETRPANRTLSFESETLEQIDPVGEKCVADSGQPIGYVNVTSAHTGYKAKYWKIVKVDGEETERIQINSSNYIATPRTASVGTAGDTGAMAAAISTQNIDYCKGIASSMLGADGGLAASQAQAVADALAATAAAAADANAETAE